MIIGQTVRRLMWTHGDIPIYFRRAQRKPFNDFVSPIRPVRIPSIFTLLTARLARRMDMKASQTMLMITDHCVPYMLCVDVSVNESKISLSLMAEVAGGVPSRGC